MSLDILIAALEMSSFSNIREILIADAVNNTPRKTIKLNLTDVCIFLTAADRLDVANKVNIKKYREATNRLHP